MTIYYHTYNLVQRKIKKKSIIIVYEIFGLTDHIKNVAEEYAKNGFLV